MIEYLLVRLSALPFGRDVRGVARKLLRDKSGVTAVEYGLIAAGIAGAIIVILFLVGEDIVAIFELVRTRILEGLDNLV